MSDLPPEPKRILAGLIARLQKLELDGFAAIWVDNNSLDRHLLRRQARGEVMDVLDYERKTLAVMREATKLTVVIPRNERVRMRVTGKMAIISRRWAVLLSEDGAIVTSYPLISDLVSFEQRHRQAGDEVHEYDIPDDARSRIESLLG